MPEKSSQPRYETSNNDMPDVLDGDYLIDVLMEIGIVRNGFSGAVSITDLDIVAYKINTGLQLSYWDCNVLKKLSSAYASMLDKAKSKHCLAPYISQRELDANKRAEIAKARIEWARSRAR